MTNLKIKNISQEEFHVSVELENRTWQVQLVDERFKADCLIFIDGEEFNGAHDQFEELEDESLQVIEAAEDFASEIESQAEWIDLGFNCLINGVDAQLKVDGDQVLLMSVDRDYSSYRQQKNVLAEFDSLEAAYQYVDKYRTDEHQDIQGLCSLLQAHREG